MEEPKKGLSLRKLNYLMSAITFVISAVLLVTTFLTANRYRSVRSNTEDYIAWNRNAELLMTGSDYLTDQVRLFAFKGEREYLDNYFREAKETRQRDKALEALEDLRHTDAFKRLEEAMSESVKLMQTEYYSMRLVVDAQGYDLSTYPEEIRDVIVARADAELDKDKKMELALKLLVDEEYNNAKERIRKGTQSCLAELADIMENRTEESLGSLNVTLFIQQMLIVGLVIVILVVLILTSIQVIQPLVSAVPRIREDQPLPAGKGAYEYRYLAKTYNKMYEANRLSKKQLTFEANHDKLTGLYNRGGFEQFLMLTDIETAAFLLIDIDDFKNINDNNGHDIGDRALIFLSEVLRRNFRTGDCICRMGGDEFAVVLTRISKDREHFKNKIIEKIARINEELCRGDSDVPVFSISAGVSFGDGSDNVEDLLKNADDVLYDVKKAGKKACKFYEE